MKMPLRVGDILYGYCAGHFGRDSYGPRRVEAIGADWVVARDKAGTAGFAQCDPETLLKESDAWKWEYGDDA